MIAKKAREHRIANKEKIAKASLMACKDVKLRPWLGASPRADFMQGKLGIDVWHYLDLVRPS